MLPTRGSLLKVIIGIKLEEVVGKNAKGNKNSKKKKATQKQLFRDNYRQKAFIKISVSLNWYENLWENLQ